MVVFGEFSFIWTQKILTKFTKKLIQPNIVKNCQNWIFFKRGVKFWVIIN